MVMKMLRYQQILLSSLKSYRFSRAFWFGVGAYLFASFVQSFTPGTYQRLGFVLSACILSLLLAYSFIHNRESFVALVPVSKTYFVYGIYVLVVGLPMVVLLLIYTLLLLYYSVLFWISCFFTPENACLNIMEQMIPSDTNGLLTWKGVLLLLIILIVFIFVNATLSFLKNKPLRIGLIVLFNVLFFIPLRLFENGRLARHEEVDLALWIQAQPHGGLLLLGFGAFVLLLACVCVLLGRRFYLQRSL